MNRRFAGLLLWVGLAVSMSATGNEFSAAAIAKRYPESAPSRARVSEARMHGECLVGLKELNFRKANEFDPVAEWTNYRTISLLEQFPPCEVLVMMEVARQELERLRAAQEAGS